MIDIRNFTRTKRQVSYNPHISSITAFRMRRNIYLQVVEQRYREMEGYPLAAEDTSMPSAFSYVNEHVPMSYSEDSLLEDLQQLPEDIQREAHKTPQDIVSQIGNELYTAMQGTFREPPDPEDEELAKNMKLITEFREVSEKLHREFRASLERTREKESALRASYAKTQESLDTVRKFSSFLQGLDPEDHAEIQEMMVTLSEKIRDKDTLSDTKAAYQKELYILQNYLYKYLKPLNSGNMGNTCSLCFQKPVDTFLNPCGHTGCSECMKRLREMDGSDNRNHCFFCRKTIHSFHKLYFP